jgi:hypothetical protein
MWFPEKNKNNKDYILHNYGCGTIATADLLLYLARRSDDFRSPETQIALNTDNSIDHRNYDAYVRRINDKYTKTRRYIAVLGTKIASAFNSYSKTYGLGYHAYWKWTLSYYDMYEIIVEMLNYDIPVIISIGPNTPKFWENKGIPFYQRYEVTIPDSEEQKSPTKQYRYRAVMQDINSHYVTVTGIIKDNLAHKIMLRISSWGVEYYINYEEYRNYIENCGGTFTSSLVQIKR